MAAGETRGSKPHAETVKSLPGWIRISVVVPTYRRPAQLSRCLAALFRQEFDPSAYEILVADDAVSDQTRRLVECWAERIRSDASVAGPALRYLPVVGAHGPAAARNTGWRAARGEIVAFTDDDCLPAPTWLRAGASAFVDGIAGVAGQVIVPLPDEPTDFEFNLSHLQESEFVTANCFYRRSTLAAIGGFDERFTVAWREDSDVFLTLLERDRRLVQARSAVVVHPIAPVPWGVSLAQQRKNLFNALLYKKHPDLYWKRIQPAPPWHYYGAVGALLLALTGGLAGRRRLMLLGLVVWLALTGQFCARRLRGTSHAPRHIAEMMVTSALIPPLAVYWRVRGALKYRVFFL